VKSYFAGQAGPVDNLFLSRRVQNLRQHEKRLLLGPQAGQHEAIDHCIARDEVWHARRQIGNPSSPDGRRESWMGLCDGRSRGESSYRARAECRRVAGIHLNDLSTVHGGCRPPRFHHADVFHLAGPSASLAADVFPTSASPARKLRGQLSCRQSRARVLWVPSLTCNRCSFNGCPLNSCSRGRRSGFLRLGRQRERHVLFTIQSLADRAIDSRQRRRLHPMVWRHVVEGVAAYPIRIRKAYRTVLECDHVLGLPRPHDHRRRDGR
jgi:hypothetical protein